MKPPVGGGGHWDARISDLHHHVHHFQVLLELPLSTRDVPRIPLHALHCEAAVMARRLLERCQAWQA
eukprot:CAMPEP_0119108670 /NCGR_PEP_ID=MMETSP1180-20130426/15594_1 /TAXON_ID=3052 ORGANISM="Chlamydomonas cf sp, Strain CCMP681" /NCGR_SAMPLE_ID=MMETSP1180 /ASSEMBLY_ACC=CAM_ASM_000741 /LENGTH=66 /DNA_ID=CAMNT_0007094315 /DNA_START=1413 /DNA_END=1614 /DNA_ORIENTATION=-